MFTKYLVTAVIACSMFFTVQAAQNQFGETVNSDDVIKVSTVLATPDSYVDKQIVIKGIVTNVCSKRGCWMTVQSDQRFQELFVKVRDGEMVFPMSARGKDALIKGKLTSHPLSLEQSKSYLADEAKKQGKAFDPESVTAAVNFYQLTPSGVTILD